MYNLRYYGGKFVLVVDLKETPAYITGASDISAIFQHDSSTSRYFGDFRFSGLREIDATLAHGLIENYVTLQKRQK